MGRRPPPEPPAVDLDEAMAERRIAWLLRPLVTPPTTDPRTIGYLSKVGAEVRAELAHANRASATERLLRIEALLRSRPLITEHGFSADWSCWDWASRFMRSAEDRWHKSHPAS